MDVSSHASQSEPQRVVVVDDNPDWCELLRALLERDGSFRVVAQTGDGESGLAAVREHQPDVVMLDLALPVMDGFQALPLIRQEASRAKVIVVSGSDPHLISFGSAGPDAYFRKGSSLKGLIARVHEVVAAS